MKLYRMRRDYPEQDKVTLYFTDGTEKVFDMDCLVSVKPGGTQGKFKSGETRPLEQNFVYLPTTRPNLYRVK